MNITILHEYTTLSHLYYHKNMSTYKYCFLSLIKLILCLVIITLSSYKHNILPVITNVMNDFLVLLT